jgi:hypothetical protein
MQSKIGWVIVVVCVAAALYLAVKNKQAIAAGDMPLGHGIKCLKADGQTPCGDAEISNLNSDILGIKKIVVVGKKVAGDAKTAVGDAKSVVGDAQQGVSDAKQLGSDAKQLGSDAKSKNLAQGVSDAKTAAGDAKAAKGDAQSTVGDVQSAAGDGQQVVSDLKGIGSLKLKSPDGAVSCAQDNGSACSDAQTKALQTHAAQKTPPITVKRDVDQASN